MQRLSCRNEIEFWFKYNFMEAYEITLGTILKRKELRGIKGGGSVTHAGTPSGGILDPLSVVSPVQIPAANL